MFQLMPQLRIYLAISPCGFRRGIDSLAALCKNELKSDPMSGSLFVFRNRSSTALKIIYYDGLGYYLIHRRFSRGTLAYWPERSNEPIQQMAAQHLAVLLAQGNPMHA